ncbi:MAG TPA: Calx-beta domain-containing protein, partial [Ilumatobacter sp.]|nr:Calx-beta domain-containing protein [Ilumatobacter sp.]
QTSAIARVVVNRDAVDELDETFRVTLSDPTNATLAGDGLAVGTIRNDDNPALRIADLARAEGNSGATSFPFAVSLSAVSLEPVTVKYSTAAGAPSPATAGTDYSPVTGATLTIPAGALTASAPVAVTGDTLLEPNETFFVTLSTAVNATIADGLAVGTIATDDADTTPPTVSAPTTDFRSDISLPASSNPIPIRVSFTATDPSGIASTNLQQKVGTAAYVNIPLAPANATTKDLFVAPGSTTRRFRARATDGASPANTCAFSTGSAFRIRARQNGSSSVVQSGAWTSVSNTNHYGGSVRHTSVAGRKQSLTAVMTDVALVSTRASDRGMAKIFIDGIERATIDLYSASTQYRRVVYQFSFAGPAASHTVELRVLGTRNAASTGARVDFDAFLVMTP